MAELINQFLYEGTSAHTPSATVVLLVVRRLLEGLQVWLGFQNVPKLQCLLHEVDDYLLSPRAFPGTPR